MIGAVRRARRDCGGFTLIEVLLVVAISGIIAIPILAWMVVGFRTEEVVQTNSAVAGATNELGIYFARDVSSASEVDLAKTNCAGAAPGETVELSLLNHDQSQRIVYLGVVRGRSGSLIRRICAPSGPTVDEVVLFDDVALPLANSLTTTPSSSSVRPTDPWARIDLRVITTKGSSIDVTGSRRTGSDG